MSERQLRMRFLIVYVLLGYIIYCLKNKDYAN